MALDLSNAMQECRRPWKNAFKIPRENGFESRIPDSSKLPVKCEGKFKTFSWARTQNNLTPMHSFFRSFQKFIHQTWEYPVDRENKGFDQSRRKENYGGRYIEEKEKGRIEMWPDIIEHLGKTDRFATDIMQHSGKKKK